MTFKYIGVFATAMLVSVAPSFAANIVVPNGNFTNSANDGTVGGGLIGSGTNVGIGSGPWTGTWNGVLGLLPPALDIDDNVSGGTATVGGILGGTDILGHVLDSSGWFQQSIGVGYSANTVYTLQANIDADAVLSVSALDNFGAGIALLNGSGIAASSSDPTQLVGITLLGGSNYQLTLQFTTGATAPTGNIGVRLFDSPNGLATAGLLQSVAFSDVTLNSSPAGAAAPEPGAFLLVGAGLLALTRVRKLKRQ